MRKRWLFRLGLLGVLGVGALLALREGDDLAFLYELQPRVVEMRIAGNGSYAESRRARMLLFDDADPKQILAAMKRELTPARGYSVETYRGSPRITFVKGESRVDMDELKHVTTIRTPSGASVKTRSTEKCWVGVVEERHWLEQKIRQLRKLVGLQP